MIHFVTYIDTYNGFSPVDLMFGSGTECSLITVIIYMYTVYSLIKYAPNPKT